VPTFLWWLARGGGRPSRSWSFPYCTRSLNVQMLVKFFKKRKDTRGSRVETQHLRLPRVMMVAAVSRRRPRTVRVV
jgi:hypothetical protein